jgi:hypothetical protein
MSNNKFTTTPVLNAIADVQKAIQSGTQNTINEYEPGYVFAPYVPLQITHLYMNAAQQSNITLISQKDNNNYIIGIAQKFRFVDAFKKYDYTYPTYDSLYPTDPDYEKRIKQNTIEFNKYDQLFVSSIEKIPSIQWSNIVPHNTNSDYIINLVWLNNQETSDVKLNGNLITQLLDQNIIEMI